MTKVSAALAVFNGRPFIEAAVQSLVVQDDLDEIIVSDDGSTDGTADVLRSLRVPKLKLLLNDRNLGQFGNFNRAIKACSGEYIQLFSHDDIARPGFISSQIAAFAASSGIGLVYSSCNNIDESGFVVGRTDDEGTPLLIDFPTYLSISSRHGALSASISSVMVRQDVFSSVGYFDDRFAVSGDLEFFNRVAEKFELARNRSFLLDVRGHSGSVTRDSCTPKQFMREEIELLRFYRRHLGERAYGEMMRFRERSRGADHAKYIMRSLLTGRFGQARAAYASLSEVHNVPLCMMHALAHKLGRTRQ